MCLSPKKANNQTPKRRVRIPTRKRSLKIKLLPVYKYAFSDLKLVLFRFNSEGFYVLFGCLNVPLLRIEDNDTCLFAAPALPIPLLVMIRLFGTVVQSECEVYLVFLGGGHSFLHFFPQSIALFLPNI